MGSPVLIDPKHNVDACICMDRQMANNAMIKEKHPMPQTEELLKNLNGKQVFSKVDMQHGFHQLQLDQSP